VRPLEQPDVVQRLARIIDAMEADVERKLSGVPAEERCRLIHDFIHRDPVRLAKLVAVAGSEKATEFLVRSIAEAADEVKP